MEYWIRDHLKAPKLGFGTYMLKKESAVEGVKQALKVGFRHIDTAQIYFNEGEVGSAIKESSVRREDIFLTTKIWKDSLTEKKVKKTFKESLKRLKTDYVDLLLIHWPNPEVPLEETLTAFKGLRAEGQIHYIGVSNFPCNLLEEARAICPDLLTNQVEYHPLLSQKKLLKQIEGQNLFLTAYSSLMRGHIFKIQQIKNLSRKYHKSPSQIVLRWLLEQKNVIPLFMSSNPDHMKENFSIFDFQLEDKDKKQLFQLNNNRQRIINPPFAPQWDE